MKKILLQLDSDRFASTFDAITAYDAGADRVLGFGGVRPEDVRDLVYGGIFTRGPKDLHQTAAFIGGRRVDIGEQMLREARQAIFEPLKVSLMLDANGCNTTSAAAVALIGKHVALKGARVVVLAGFGPVGLRAAALFALEGAQVVVTGLPREILAGQWDEARAKHDLELAQAQGNEAGFQVAPVATRAEMVALLENAAAVLAAGPAGVQLLAVADWQSHPTLKVLGDLNAAPPLGIEGIKSQWNGKEKDGRVLFGALGIGDLKMKAHKTAVASLFEANDRVLDAEAIYLLAKTL